MTTAKTMQDDCPAPPAVGSRLGRMVRPLHARKLTRTELHQMLDYAQHCENEGWYWGNAAQFRKRHDSIKAWLNAQLDAAAGKNNDGKAIHKGGSC